MKIRKAQPSRLINEGKANAYKTEERSVRARRMLLKERIFPFLNFTEAKRSANKRGINRNAVKILSVPVSGAKLRTSEVSANL